MEDGGRHPVWTQKEDPPLSQLPPAVHRWRTSSLHQTEGPVRDGPATVPTRSVSALLRSRGLKADETLEDCATCIFAADDFLPCAIGRILYRELYNVG